jgi:hypothetical protein
MELFRLLGTISIDAQQANQAIDDTTNNARDSANEQQEAFAKIGSAAGTLAKGVMSVGAVLGGAFVTAIEATREYRTSMGQLETAYTTAGHSADSAKETYADLNAILGDSGQATEAAQMLANLTDSEQELDEWTHILTGVYSEFGEALPVEGLAEAALHTAKVGEVQSSLADALEWSGKSVDDFNKQLAKCSTEQERQELITKTMNELYGEQATKYKEVNKDVIAAEQANQKLTDAFAQIGAVGEPILTAIKTKVAEMVTVAAPHIQSFVDKFKDLKQWVQDNKTTIDTWVAVIIGATVTIGAFLLILKWGAIMTAASNAIKTVRLAILALNTALRANPIGFVISLIAGLVAAFVYLWNNNEGFRKFWMNMWEKVKSITASVISAVKNKFNDLQAGFNKVKTIFGNIQKTISEKMESARKKVKDAIDKIKGFFDFKWSLPKLKMPKIGIKGKFSIDPPSVPKFSIKWNAEGAIFKQPTIFNTPYGLQGVGEAGAEAIAPIDKLQSYVASAVESNNKELIKGFEMQISRLISFMEAYFPTDYRIMLDTGILAGQLAPEINNSLADLYRYDKRGNTR